MKILKILLTLSVLSFSCSLKADVSLIRDAEIEDTLCEIVKPIFKCAGLKPETAQVYVINSDELNAFTIGGGYIFVYSGLLRRLNNPLYLIAILSHEVGHLAAGHINRKMKILTQSSSGILPLLAGVLGAALTSSPEILAVVLGYQMTDQLMYLRFSRDEEAAADKLALQYIRKMGYSSDIMVEAFEIFKRQDLLNGNCNLPVYLSSHPKVSDRISSMRGADSLKKTLVPADLQKKYQRIIVKLNAYLYDFRTSGGFFNVQPACSDDYPKAIRLHKIGKSNEAIKILRNLVKRKPDIYYLETLAEFLYETGQLEEAIKIYEKICQKKAISPLIKIAYANALIAKNVRVDEAINILEAAQYLDQASSDVFRSLAKAYGLKNQEGMAHFMLAQEQMFSGNRSKALILINKAIEELKKTKQTSRLKRALYFKQLINRAADEPPGG